MRFQRVFRGLPNDELAFAILDGATWLLNPSEQPEHLRGQRLDDVMGALRELKVRQIGGWLPFAMLVAVLFVGADRLLAQSSTAEPSRTEKNADGTRNEKGTAPAGAKDDSLASQAPLPPPDFLPSCLKLIRQRQTARARQLLEPVVADHPAWAKACFYLGLTYHREKRYERAAEFFKRSLEADPLYHALRVYYGWCLYYLGEPEAAREMLESYLEVEPDYPDALFALGLIAFDADEVASAQRLFERVIVLAQTKGDAKTEAKARARLADLLIRLDKIKPAKAQLDRSIVLNPDNFEVYYKLSRVLERLGEREAAQAARLKHDEVRARIMKKNNRDQGTAAE